uniref:Neurotransmitter-gated ion-channel ligand-binding domain-containing protein n=1 Tax=Timema bartmani TaxID=61472 RepID=A0A7R9ETI6_9NEOP|nr:unnamed protein product [Timema bartmani]
MGSFTTWGLQWEKVLPSIKPKDRFITERAEKERLTEQKNSRDYEVDLYLKQKWQDERLKHSEITEALDLNDPNLVNDYEVDLYLRQKWQDERLKHSEITEALDLNDPNLVKAIWKPEVYFPNAKHAEFQYVTVPNVLVRINPDGEILYMLRGVGNLSLISNITAPFPGRCNVPPCYILFPRPVVWQVANGSWFVDSRALWFINLRA